MADDNDHSQLRFQAHGNEIVTSPEPVSISNTSAQFEILEMEKRLWNIKTIQQPQSISYTVWQNLVSIFTLMNALFYIAALCVNISAARKQGQPYGQLAIPIVFVISQMLEHSSTITEGLWRLCVITFRNNKSRPTLRIFGDKVPAVVMIIVTCGEPLDIIMDTVRAALTVDYPKALLQIVVSDDKKSAELRKEVNLLKTRHANLHYNTREVNRGYKAGNLNDCLQYYVKNLKFEPEWICVLDADMMPEKHILRTMVPHGILDKYVGMITTGQHFYNIPSNDPLYQSNITGTHAEDGARDSVGTAWCPGSGFLIKYSAWSHIEMFPEFSTTEDLFTSWYLHGKGWKTLLVHDVLQWGIQPECFVVHMKQRRRWWTGHLAKVITNRLSLNDPMLKHASLIQRWAMLQHCFRPFNNTIFKALSLVLVAVCAISPYKVIAVPNQRAVARIFLSVFMSRLVPRLSELKAIPPLSRHWNMRRRQATNTWLALHFSIDTIKEILAVKAPKTTGCRRITFEVTGVEETRSAVAHERDEKLRPSMLQRLLILHDREGILWYPVVAVLASGILIGRFAWLYQTSNDESFWFDLICSVGFPGLGLVELLPLLLTPISYAMFPPTSVPRRQLMRYDAENELWRPTEEAKIMQWTTETSIWLEIPHLVAFLWLLCVVAKFPWLQMW